MAIPSIANWPICVGVGLKQTHPLLPIFLVRSRPQAAPCQDDRAVGALVPLTPGMNGRIRHRCRALVGAVTLAGLAAVPGAFATSAYESSPTPQAAGMNAASMEYLSPPPVPATVCVVDTGVDLTPDTAPFVVNRLTVMGDGLLGDTGPARYVATTHRVIVPVAPTAWLWTHTVRLTRGTVLGPLKRMRTRTGATRLIVDVPVGIRVPTRIEWRTPGTTRWVGIRIVR